MLSLRTLVSMGFTPAACNFTSTLYGPVRTGAGISAGVSTSGPPAAFITTALMTLSSVYSGSSAPIAAKRQPIGPICSAYGPAGRGLYSALPDRGFVARLNRQDLLICQDQILP